MMKRTAITVEFKSIGLNDETLSLPIIKVGTVEGLTPFHAGRIFGLTEIEMRSFLKKKKIETDRLPASGMETLKDAGIISPKARICRYLSRTALYRMARAIGTKAAMESFSAVWRVGRAFDSAKSLGRILSPKSMLAECTQKIQEQERRILALEKQIQKLSEFLMDNMTLEPVTQEKAQ